MPRFSTGARPGTGLNGRASALRSRLVADAKPRPSPPNYQDLTGKTFGQWTVLGRLVRKGKPDWRVRCRCGYERAVLGERLRTQYPRCAACGAAAGPQPVPKPKPPRVAPLPIDVDERPVTNLWLRCSSCQSFGGFVAGRCVNCGRGTVEYLEHVDGRRSA